MKKHLEGQISHLVRPSESAHIFNLVNHSFPLNSQKKILPLFLLKRLQQLSLVGTRYPVGLDRDSREKESQHQKKGSFLEDHILVPFTTYTSQRPPQDGPHCPSHRELPQAGCPGVHAALSTVCHATSPPGVGGAHTAHVSGLATPPKESKMGGWAGERQGK